MRIFFFALGGIMDHNSDRKSGFDLFVENIQDFIEDHPVWFSLILIAFVIEIVFLVYFFCNLSNRIESEKECPTLVTVHLVGYEDLFVRPKTNVILPTPERDGFVFRGWFLDSACTVPYISTEPVKKELILYPKWEKEVG